MAFTRLIQECKIRCYSAKTQESYLYYNNVFLKFCKKDASKITKSNIRLYLEHLADTKKSGATMRQVYCALLFYYRDILGTNLMQGIKIPKADQKVTVGLTQEEVKRLFSVITNPKHKLLVELLYGSGLRVGEAVKIKYKDILVNENVLIVRAGKGKKDRMTIVSNRVLEKIQEQQGPHRYLFEGRSGHLTVRSVQQILKNAAKKAGIQKRVYPHLLRHAFATHLDQNNVKTRHLQKVLGHKDQKTTNRYINDSPDTLKTITSPHDFL